MARKPKYKLAVIDAETDPFLHGRIPKPFAWEFHSDDVTEVFWGEDCTSDLALFLASLKEPHMIFAHNGGKFDFHYLHEYLANPIKIINSRIVSSAIDVDDRPPETRHVLRDSLAIIPVPLARFFKGSKGDIDYRKMERQFRGEYKGEILDYLHQDCMSLLKVVSVFVERFGAKLTVGSTAMSQLSLRHDYEKMHQRQDALFRPFYYGGRVQCFQHGIIKGPLIMLDVNSEYPTAMKKFSHPISATFHQVDYMPDSFDVPFFVEFTGSNDGALPMKTENGSLSFEVEHGRFMACSHELQKALEYGLVKIDRVHSAWIPAAHSSFANFVDEFYAEKVNAKKAGDELGEMFAKFMLNSAYGKFGSNPDNFRDWIINRDFGADITLQANEYRLEAEFDDFELWSKPAANADNSFYNVATAASITSAARSIMLDGIQKATDPIYCDTDSILCRGFTGEISSTELGAWKLEKTAPMAAVAGKKLYALYDPVTLELPKTVQCDWNPKLKNPNPERKALKLSSKGGQLTVDEIIEIAGGGRVTFKNDAPTFSLHNDPKFISRNFVSTVDEEPELI